MISIVAVVVVVHVIVKELPDIEVASIRTFARDGNPVRSGDNAECARPGREPTAGNVLRDDSGGIEVIEMRVGTRVVDDKGHKSIVADPGERRVVRVDQKMAEYEPRRSRMYEVEESEIPTVRTQDSFAIR